MILPRDSTHLNSAPANEPVKLRDAAKFRKPQVLHDAPSGGFGGTARPRRLIATPV